MKIWSVLYLFVVCVFSIILHEHRVQSVLPVGAPSYYSPLDGRLFYVYNQKESSMFSLQFFSQSYQQNINNNLVFSIGNI